MLEEKENLVNYSKNRGDEMLIYCSGCNEVISCTQRGCLCEDCIEAEIAEETGQLCSSKMDKEFPQVILCSKCEAQLLLDFVCFGIGG